MKKILLLGDSIRLGYEGYVKESLNGIAEVYSSKDTSQFAQYLFRWLHVWKEKERYPEDMDLVHWNVGAWDVLRIFDEGTFTSAEYYGEMLKRLSKRISFLFPKAKQIFATCTSVVEDGYEPPYQRYNSDIEKFNGIAKETLIPLGVIIDDLYSVTKVAPASCRSDMTHFYTCDGIKLIGTKVTEAICKQIDIPLEKIKNVSAIIPKLSKELIGC